MFILFNTKSQALNYIKRNYPSCGHDEGCGCCWWRQGGFIDGNKVYSYAEGEYIGDYKYTKKVIGRIKTKK